MICEHCGKPMKLEISVEKRFEVLRLHAGGYSCRDIEAKIGVSFSSAARIIRAAKREGKKKK